MKLPTLFAADIRGNVAIMFSFAVIGAVGLAGLAIEYSRAQSIQVIVSSAADSAALAAVKGGLTTSDRRKIAENLFLSNINAIDGVSKVVMTPKDIKKNGEFAALEVSGYVRMPSSLGGLFGKKYLDIGFNSRATASAGDFLEVALALDTTGSMSGSKMTALKQAAKDLVQTLKQKNKTGEKVKIAVVPFAQYVNVGLSNRGKSWIDVPHDTSTTSNKCWTNRPVTSKTNCRTVPYTYTNDGVTYSSTKTTCDYTYGEPVEVCKDVTNTSKWNGCVGSRNYPLNTNDISYNTKIPGLMNTWCPREIQPLTAEQGLAISAIETMSASGNTYIPAGLIWAWRALSPIAPFDSSKQGKSNNVKQALILMTDGANTKSPSYPFHNGSDSAVANQITLEICSNIKSSGVDITIYTIAFGVTDPTIKNILQTCASSPTANYFDATNASQLTAAFKNIGQSLSKLRLNR